MTKDDVMHIANETAGTWWMDEAHIQRFAAKVYAAGVKAEREACAKVCEDEAEKWEGDDGPISTEARLCALNIRARGTS